MRRRVLALLLPTLLVGAACKRSEHPESLLLVTLDTTRADRLGCYGWANAGTHALDALAERSLLLC